MNAVACSCGETTHQICSEFLEETYWIECLKCDAKTSAFETREEAIDAWNSMQRAVVAT